MSEKIEVYALEEAASVEIDMSNTIKGDTGGYYKPSVNSDGDISWQASRGDMPPVASSNIKGVKGDKGDIGLTPQISVEVSAKEAGSEADVNVSGTAENPLIHFAIPRGDSGVYIGADEPTDPSIDVWIDTDGEAELEYVVTTEEKVQEVVGGYLATHHDVIVTEVLAALPNASGVSF